MHFFGSPKPKVFCIGCCKTGTVSLGALLESFGFAMGDHRDQNEAELLIEDWARRDFRKIINYCKKAKADAFKDVPFSLPYTYQVLDYCFPWSRFILSVRSSSQEWYESVIRFHTKLIGAGRLPTAQDLKESDYCQPGWLWRAEHLVYGIDETEVWDRDHYINQYCTHNERVIDYFRYRPDDLLVLNVGDPSAMPTLCNFLNVPYRGQLMPYLNRSR